MRNNLSLRWLANTSKRIRADFTERGGNSTFLNSQQPLELPNEILTAIFEHLDDSCLFHIAQLSKIFNELALRVYLSHHHVSASSISSQNISLTSAALPGLRLAFFIPAVKQLTCTFHHPEDSRGIWELQALVSRLPPIGDVKLDFRVSGNKGITDVVRGLLRQMLGNSCTIVMITSMGRVTISRPRRIFGWKMDNPYFSENALGVRLVADTRALFDFHFKWQFGRRPPDTREPVRCYRYNQPHRAVNKFSLRSLHIQYPITSTRPFDTWTTIAINPVSIKKVLLEAELSRVEWAAVLPRITLPSISRVQISRSAMSVGDLDPFLARHPNIIHLCISEDDDPLSMPHNLPKFPSTSLPRLTHIRTSAVHLIHLLDSEATFPDLWNIFITCHSGRNGVYDFEPIDNALRLVARRTKDTHLSLAFPWCSKLSRWMTVGDSDEGDGRVERSLHCVKQLSLCWSLHDSIPVFPRWVALFPAVYFLELVDLDIMPQHIRELPAIVSDACPELETIQVGGDRRPATHWRTVS